jgi:hypothetical protein
MGASEMRFAFEDDATFRAVADARAAQKFNHLRGAIWGRGADSRTRSRTRRTWRSSAAWTSAYATSTARASRPI